MKQVLFLGAFVTIAVLGLYYGINFYDANMKWSRMHQTPAVRPYEEPMLIMEEGIVPIDGGERVLRASLKNDTQPRSEYATQTLVAKGKEEYRVFCSPCHGNHLDGLGTVGQSFNPLPTDLNSSQVIQMSDSQMFSLISDGSKRSPALASSMAAESRWAVISYVRSKQEENR
jgi:mono/diheme cytochrome c family protein